ncbi:hypothetical protein [Caldivirga sp.]|uniref:hypothetical protein n=1 Tax=Caldivirga sp. TaxID=2080243 RepID=UPI003D0F5952
MRVKARIPPGVNAPEASLAVALSLALKKPDDLVRVQGLEGSWLITSNLILHVNGDRIEAITRRRLVVDLAEAMSKYGLIIEEVIE